MGHILHWKIQPPAPKSWCQAIIAQGMNAKLYIPGQDQRCMRGASYHLCQCYLCLREPQRHRHGAVERDGGGQGGAGLLPLAGCGV